MSDRSIKNLTKNANWVLKEGANVSDDKLQLSCLMRIADAVETMAKSYNQMQEDRDWYKRRYESSYAKNQRLRHSVAGHKAAYTKLKNKIANGMVRLG